MEEDPEALIQASESGNLIKVQKLLKQNKYDLDLTDKSGETALM